MTAARGTGLASWAAIALLVCAPAATRAGAAQVPDRYIEPHQPAEGELELRQLLASYADGRTADAVKALLAHPREWMTALDATLERIEADLAFHRRPQNRGSATGTARLERRLRADQLQVLRLTAALQLDAAAMVTDVEQVGHRILDSERAVRALERVRVELDKVGPVEPSVPVATLPNETLDPAEPRATFDSAAVNVFVQSWYGAAAARLQALVEMTLGPALIDRGLVRFPDDPDLLVARGSYAETRVALDRVDVSLAQTLYTSDERWRFGNALERAAADYARARRTTGDASEGTLRLARVRLLRGEAAAARELLDRVYVPELPLHLRVLALMFRASAAEAQGDLEAAVRDYREALRQEPEARSPAVALSRIAVVRKQPAEALEWADRAMAPAGGRDPWRAYIQGQAWQLDARLAVVRMLATH